ncbi:MAG: ABC transporter permease, partial [Nitrospinota bacterium]
PFVYLEGLAFAALGMVAASLAPSYSFFNFHFSLIITPMFFFSGIFFPLEGYPGWVRGVSELLPLTHAVRISRGFITTGELGGLLWSALYLLGLALVFFSLARWLVERKVVT